MRRLGRDPNNPAPGIRRHGAGWQTRVKVRGEWAHGSWPFDTPLSEMIEWIKDERARLRTALPKTLGGTFAADVKKYLKLESVKAMPTFDERKRHLAEACLRFGARRRHAIRPLEIEEWRDTLLPLMAPASVNKRLRALSNLWTKLDGRRAANPVREIAECEEPYPEARAIPYDVIDAILAEMPEHAVGVKGDGTRTAGKARVNKARIVCTIYAYAGLTPEQLKTLEPSDFDADAGTVRLVPRKKGRKPRSAHGRGAPQLVPLVPQAIAALARFGELKLWGVRFSNSTVHRSFTAACERLNLTGVRVYDLRHSFLTAVYADTPDLRVTGIFGGHRSESTTKRYTLAAVPAHVQAAAERLRARFAVATGLATSDAETSGIKRNLADGQPGGQPPHEDEKGS